MRIGFIGLGNMGRPMAGNLLKAGFSVTVWNRFRARAEAVGDCGATVAETAADAARSAEILISMLANDAAVEEVFLGSGGALAALPAGAVHLSSSTISVALADRLAEAHAAAGSHFVSAPVMGRPDAATAAKLFFVAAGPAAAVEQCRPLFEAMGQRTFVMGERPSAANVTKLSANFLIASVIECLAEAFAFTGKSGIDPAAYLDLLTSTLFAAPIYRTYGTLVSERRFQPAGFKLALGLKDLRLALQAADAQAVPMPAASLVHDRLLAAVAQGMGEDDWSALAEVVMRNAGL